mgnify:CR=1 FL=1
MIKNLVFDVGNVLVTFDPDTYISGFVANPAKVRYLSHKIFLSRFWKAGDLGMMTRQESVDAICEENPGYETLIHRILQNCNQMLTEVPQNTHFLKELKEAGFSLYILSNTNSSAWEYMTTHYALFQYMDGVTVSFMEHCLKPEPEIFKRLIMCHNLVPENCIFVDDMEVNTNIARILGFQTITLQHPTRLREELMKIPVICNAFPVK